MTAPVVEGAAAAPTNVNPLNACEGLKVPANKPSADASGSARILHPGCAEHRNHVWSYDFVEDRTMDHLVVAGQTPAPHLIRTRN